MRHGRAAIAVTTLMLTLSAAGALAPGAAAEVVTQRTPLTVGDQPEAVAALGANGTFFVGNRGANSISVLNARTRTVVATSARPGGTATVALAVDRTRNRVYDLDLDDRLFIRNTSTRALLTTVRLPVSARIQGLTVALTPRDVAVDAGTNRIFVVASAGRLPGRLLGINGETGATLWQAQVGVEPRRLALTASASHVLVSNSGSDTVSVVNASTGAVTQAVTVGDQPHGIAVYGSRVAVTNNGSDSLSIGSFANGALSLPTSRTAGIGDEPIDVVVDTANSEVQRLYVVNRASGTVSVFRLSEQILPSGMAHLETVDVGGPLAGIDVERRSHRVVVARPGANRVAVLARFEPGVHGFAFPNFFTFPLVAGPFTVTPPPPLPPIVVPQVDLSRNYGLCGGMVWAALDTFDLGLRRPATGPTPPTSGAVFDYVFQRLVDTLANNAGQMLGRFLDLQLKPDAELETISGTEIEQILPSLDDGRPVPLGLVHVAGLAEPWRNHQVLAIGHFTRRDGERVIEIYDPNAPDQVSFLFTEQRAIALDRAGTDVVTSADGQPVPVRALFSTLPAYVRETPPW